MCLAVNQFVGKPLQHYFRPRREHPPPQHRASLPLRAHPTLRCASLPLRAHPTLRCASLPRRAHPTLRCASLPLRAHPTLRCVSPPSHPTLRCVSLPLRAHFPSHPTLRAKQCASHSHGRCLCPQHCLCLHIRCRSYTTRYLHNQRERHPNPAIVSQQTLLKASKKPSVRCYDCPN